jgi:simple sugar transport system permease protein
MIFTKVYITTYIGLIILLVSTFVIYKTKFGLRLRACGEHPTAADSVGINVYRIRYMGVIISGFLAGIGGVVLIVPTSTNFNADVGGYGFLALAVLIFGQWNPLRVLLASAFFGFMKTLGAAYAVIPFLAAMKIPSGVYKMMPYIVTIIVLIFTSKHSQAPKAVGQVYDKATR